MIWIWFGHARSGVIDVVHRFAVADQRVTDQRILEQPVFASPRAPLHLRCQ
ncbi:MAG TPA: hypothetical protein VJU61_29475 [Polyangiaceae bacterium]|nr:hypothetical protein [Polyangiaceae bacterium]